MELDELYQEIILDHYRKPRNAARLTHVPEARVHENPACGDSVKLEVTVSPDRVVDRVRFDGKGCAISTASASIMTEQARGRSVEEVKRLARHFIGIMRGEQLPESLDQMGDLACLKGVVRFPVRVKCATLAWHALLETLP